MLKMAQALPHEALEAVRESQAWLRERWAFADTHRAEIRGMRWYPPYHRYYWDPASEEQLAQLRRHGLDGLFIELSRGQVSDVVGLTLDPEPEDLDALAWLKVAPAAYNRLRVRDQLLAPGTQAVLANRPPTPLLHVTAAFVGFTIERGLTYEEAVDRMVEHTFDTLPDGQLRPIAQRFDETLKFFLKRRVVRRLGITPPTPEAILRAVRAAEADHVADPLDLAAIAWRLGWRGEPTHGGPSSC